MTGWILFAALLGTTGALSLRWAILPRADVSRYPAGTREALIEGVARFGGYIALLLPLAFLLVFTRQLLEFRDPFVPWTEDAHLLLTGTPWGHTFIVFGLLGVAVVPGFQMARRRPAWGWPAVTALVLALGTFPALTGHANAGEGLTRAVTLGADILHVWAAGGWMGGLAALLFLDRTARRGQTTPADLLTALVPAFSPVAVTCVAILVASGVVGAWMHVAEPLALLTGTYGRTLSLKLLVVAVVLGLGWLNWKKLTPRLGGPTGEPALRRAATIELTVAQVVLLVTAILVRTPP